MKFSLTSNVFHKYTKKKKTWIFNVIQFILFFIIFIFVAGVLYQFIAAEMDKNQFKMKGKYVSVGSYRLMVNTSGNGKYTVAFEGDMGTPMQQWNGVREQMGRDYRLFSYERSGYGWSDSSSENIDLSRSVSDLKNALSRSGCSAPYILVGHGYGGLIMTEFAKKYPNEVVGVVLVDSLVEENVKSKEFQNKLKIDIGKFRTSRFFSYMGGIRLAYSLDILKNDEPFTKNLTDSEKALFESQRVTPKYYEAYCNELKILKGYNENLQQQGALKDIFVEILTPANKYNDEKRDKEYGEQQKKLAALSSKGEQMLVERTSTYIQVDRPDAIINAIDRIAKKAGKL